MSKVPCVVEIHSDGEVDLHFPSVSALVGLGGVRLVKLDEGVEENRIDEYQVVGNPNVRVFCWENVHPNDWSPELRQVNDSYGEGI